MNISFEKIVHTLERDIRNQVVIDQMKKLTRRGKIMVFLRRINWLLISGIAFSFLFWLIVGATMALADPASVTQGTGEVHVPCPDAQPCKVLIITQAEERLLTGQNGILDTAAQGRAIDLGQFAVYLKTKIATAPAGEVKPVEKPAVENKPAAPVDTPQK